ncbi:MAG: hypothetical protein ACXVBH_02125 [Flavisolibacter sp.]
MPLVLSEAGHSGIKPNLCRLLKNKGIEVKKQFQQLPGIPLLLEKCDELFVENVLIHSIGMFWRVWKDQVVRLVTLCTAFKKVEPAWHEAAFCLGIYLGC